MKTSIMFLAVKPGLETNSNISFRCTIILIATALRSFKEQSEQTVKLNIKPSEKISKLSFIKHFQ